MRVEERRGGESRAVQSRVEERGGERSTHHAVEHALRGACITGAAWDWVRVRARLGVE